MSTIICIAIYLAGVAIAISVIYLVTRKHKYYKSEDSITSWQKDRGDFIALSLLSWFAVFLLMIVLLIEFFQSLNYHEED